MDDVQTTISRAAINDDIFQVLIGLVHHGFYGAFEAFLIVQINRNDGYFHVRYVRFYGANKALISLLIYLRIVLNFRLSKRSEEHTSELQSRENLVCRLLLE